MLKSDCLPHLMKKKVNLCMRDMKPTPRNIAALSMTLSFSVGMREKDINKMRGVYVLVNQCQEVLSRYEDMKNLDMENLDWQCGMAVLLVDKSAEHQKKKATTGSYSTMKGHVKAAVEAVKMCFDHAHHMAQMVLQDLYTAEDDDKKSLLEGQQRI